MDEDVAQDVVDSDDPEDGEVRESPQMASDIPPRVRTAMEFVRMCGTHTPVVIYEDSMKVQKIQLPASQDVAFRLACRLLGRYFEHGTENADA